MLIAAFVLGYILVAVGTVALGGLLGFADADGDVLGLFGLVWPIFLPVLLIYLFYTGLGRLGVYLSRKVNHGKSE